MKQNLRRVWSCPRGFILSGWVAALWMLAAGGFAQGTDAPGLGVSRPAGYVQVYVPSNGLALASMPFKAFAGTGGLSFSDPLQSGATPGSSDALLRWDPHTGAYERYYHLQDAHDGEPGWALLVGESLHAQPPLLLPGDAFWMHRRGASGLIMFLSGEVNLSPTYSRALAPGLNLLGLPYLGAFGFERLGLEPGIGRLQRWDPFSGGYVAFEGVALDDGARWLDAHDRPAEPLVPGEGFVLEHEGAGRAWRLENPFADPFDPPGSLPRIASVQVDAAESVVRLQIESEAGQDIPLYVLYQDIGLEDSFEEFGWSYAGSLTTRWQASLVWEDSPLTGARADIAQTHSRVYLLVRADIDSDGDGLADGLERFFYGTDPYNPDSSGNGLPDGWLVRHGLDPLAPSVADASSKAGDGFSNRDKFRLGLDPSRALSADRQNRLRLRVASPME